MIVSRTVSLADPLARANVIEALSGPGGPAGVLDVSDDDGSVVVRFDDAITSAELIDDLIAIESLFIPAKVERPLEIREAAAIAAAGLGDPELDAGRVIEAYLAPEERA
ncbi:MAG TPA: hypothetical protein VE591_09955 [Candidatus Acidoferrum sp.]|nr:hypothetical protein [Candidatus Acidoferrum sp.]